MTGKPRILVVSYIGTGGGVTESVFTSFEMLRRAGAECVALVPGNFVFLERLSSIGVTARTIAGFDKSGSLRTPFQAAAIARIAREERADLILVNNGRHVPWLARLTKTPVVAIYHGGKVGRFLRAARVVTINDAQRDMLIAIGYPAANVEVVDNALPMNTLPPYCEREAKTDPVVGTLRLLEPAKGVDVLIEAIALLARRGLALETHIGSSGSQHAILEARVRELGLTGQIRFLGWIDDRDAFYRGLDIYVLPSRSEEWGIGIVEAQAASLPVIATACLGPKRIVRDGETGMLVPPGDAARMADAIEALANDSARRTALARAGYDHAQANYTLPQVAPIYARAVLAALDGR